jgi:hypothetical protein
MGRNHIPLGSFDTCQLLGKIVGCIKFNSLHLMLGKNDNGDHPVVVKYLLYMWFGHCGFPFKYTGGRDVFRSMPQSG